MSRRVPAWRVFLWVKLIELTLQARPKALWRCFFQRDPELRHAMRWYSKMGRRVVLHEVTDWLRNRRKPGRRVEEVLGSTTMPEQAHATPRRSARVFNSRA